MVLVVVVVVVVAPPEGVSSLAELVVRKIEYTGLHGKEKCVYYIEKINHGSDEKFMKIRKFLLSMKILEKKKLKFLAKWQMKI